MSNIHGLNNMPGSNGRRRQQLSEHSAGMSMFGITEQDLHVMGT